MKLNSIKKVIQPVSFLSSSIHTSKSHLNKQGKYKPKTRAKTERKEEKGKQERQSRERKEKINRRKASSRRVEIFCKILRRTTKRIALLKVNTLLQLTYSPRLIIKCPPI
jgi:hypothetical protein